MKHIILNDNQLKQLCEHYNLDYEEFIKHDGAILFEDGTIYYYDNSFPNPAFEDENLMEDFRYYALKNFIDNYGYLFDKEQIEYLNSLTVNEIEIIDNDLYIYDPKNILNIALGNNGNGWVCLMEDYF